jgi:hypothetical protein
VGGGVMEDPYRKPAAPTCNECPWLYGGPPMWDDYRCDHPRGKFIVLADEIVLRRHDRCPLRPT